MLVVKLLASQYMISGYFIVNEMLYTESHFESHLIIGKCGFRDPVSLFSKSFKTTNRNIPTALVSGIRAKTLNNV